MSLLVQQTIFSRLILPSRYSFWLSSSSLPTVAAGGSLLHMNGLSRLPAYSILVVLRASTAQSFSFLKFIAGRKTDWSQFLYVHKITQIHTTYRPFMSHVGPNRWFYCSEHSRQCTSCIGRQILFTNCMQYWPFYIIHYVVCPMTGPQPLAKRVLHRVRSSAASFNFRYLLVSLRFPVAANIFFLVFPSLISFFPSFLQ